MAKSKLFKVAAVVVSAFICTSALMYWVSLAEKSGFIPYDYGEFSGGYYSYSNEYLSLYKQQAQTTVEQREAVEGLFDSLKDSPQQNLLKLKASADNICTYGLIDCNGLSIETAQRVVESVLDDRRMARENDTMETARYANLISAGSLFVALLALIFSGLTYWRKLG
jgi:hypothetical protein